MTSFPIARAALAVVALVCACSPSAQPSHDASGAEGEKAAVTATIAPAKTAQPSQERPDTSAPRITPAQDRTFCSEFEEVIYSCPMANGRTLSVCASSIDPADISYSYGRSFENLELHITADRDNGQVHQGGVVGQGGGQQTYVRFSNQGTEYIVYSGYTGSLADADKQWSGVAIYRDGREIQNLPCPFSGGATEMVTSRIPSFVPRENDERYEAWY